MLFKSENISMWYPELQSLLQKQVVFPFSFYSGQAADKKKEGNRKGHAQPGVVSVIKGCFFSCKRQGSCQFRIESILDDNYFVNKNGEIEERYPYCKILWF